MLFAREEFLSKLGYPLGNIIFEDTRQAVLIQNKAEVMRVDLSDPEKLARLLDAFFDYVEPQIESFESIGCARRTATSSPSVS